MNCLSGIEKSNIKTKIIIMDNESTDGAPLMIKQAIKNKFFKYLDIELMECKRIEGDKITNICNIRKTLSEKVKTNFFFFLDADLFLPRMGLSLMLDIIQSNQNAGYIAISYKPFNMHQGLGCAMIRTEAIKNIKWEKKQNEGCECNSVFEQIRNQGYQPMNLSKLSALDLNI